MMSTKRRDARAAGGVISGNGTTVVGSGTRTRKTGMEGADEMGEGMRSVLGIDEESAASMSADGREIETKITEGVGVTEITKKSGIVRGEGSLGRGIL